MRMSRSRVVLSLSAMLLLTTFALAETKPTPTIQDFGAGMKRMDGFFPLMWDNEAGRLYLEVNKFDQDFLLVPSLPYGLGSNDVGLDRGKLEDGRVVHFSRVGPQVLLVQPNLDYRSSSTD